MRGEPAPRDRQRQLALSFNAPLPFDSAGYSKRQRGLPRRDNAGRIEVENQPKSDRAAGAIAAELVGICQRAPDMTVARPGRPRRAD